MTENSQNGAVVVLRLIGTMRTIQMYGPNNAAVTDSIRKLVVEVNRMRELGGGKFIVQFVDRALLVNNVALKNREVGEEYLAVLFDLFEQRHVGGIVFAEPVDEMGLRMWLSVFARPVNDSRGVRELRQKLFELVHFGIDVLERKTIATTDQVERVQVTSMSFALQAYARAIVGFRELIAAIHQKKNPFSGRINVIRVVQDLIEIANRRPDHLMKIVELRQSNADVLEQGYAEVHAANTCIYAILMGKVLGLNRLDLLDLGTSALLADVGFALLPEELTDRPGSLSPKDHEELRTFMIRAVQALIGRGKLSDQMMKRVVVAYEHHRPYADPVLKQRVDTHLYSRIVAVADAYDAMTTARRWRSALSPVDAVRSLEHESGTRFDPVLVGTLGSILVAHVKSPRSATA